MPEFGRCRIARLITRVLVPLTVSGGPVVAMPVDGQAEGSRHSALQVVGTLDADSWAAAAPIDGFVQREPAEGGPPSERTEFRVAYDATTLHVRVRAYDTQPDKVVGYLTRRDGESPSDWLRVLIDSYHDRRTAFEFAVNPAGVKQDKYWYDDTSNDPGWDAIWDVAVSRDQHGWSAEFRIPLSQLRFTPRESTTFGFAVVRHIGRLNETSTWPLLARSATGYVSSFGELTDLAMTTSPKKLELLPYSVATLTRQPRRGNPLIESSGPAAALGLDLKYALTPGLTLTATINPDFGQVEADPAVVNLSAFETFFSEQRPFFVEGSGMFGFDADCLNGPCMMFYSRRVGRAPQGTLPSGDNIHTDAPVQTTILGAAKLTGRAGPFSIGLMHATTQREWGTVLDAGVQSRRPIEPLTGYSIGRIRREFTNQSAIGVMATSTDRQPAAGLATIARHAFVGGADWDLRFRKRYAVTGYWAASSVRGAATAIADLQQTSRHYYQRPDASSFRLDRNRTSLNGSSGRIGLVKIGGSRLRANANVGYMSPGFEVNDAGFVRRADQRWTSNWLQLRSEVPTRRFRSRYLNFNHWAVWNLDGDRLNAGSNVNGNLRFVNNWSVGAGLGRDWKTFDDRLTRSGPGGLVDASVVFWSWLDSDDRKPVSLNMFNGGGGDGQGSWFRDHELTITYRPASALTIAPGFRINRAVRDYQWVKNISDTDDHYVFGHLDQTTIALTGRVNFTMTPTLSVQLYAQPFVSGGDYTGFKELANGRSDDYGGRFSPFVYRYDAADNPDFNVKSFRSTNVLRWEFKPGSTLFIVWQQAREHTEHVEDFRFGQDVRNIFRTPPRNVFLVKLAYWLNY